MDDSIIPTTSEQWFEVLKAEEQKLRNHIWQNRQI